MASACQLIRGDLKDWCDKVHGACNNKNKERKDGDQCPIMGLALQWSNRRASCEETLVIGSGKAAGQYHYSAESGNVAASLDSGPETKTQVPY